MQVFEGRSLEKPYGLKPLYQPFEIGRNNVGGRGCKYLKQAEWFHIINVNMCISRIIQARIKWTTKGLNGCRRHTGLNFSIYTWETI